ncbi:hypothetical protein ABT368_31680 [Streptomyces althioticus]|uniref:hypothetical protein n=1 Tax=Streptomyces althioticus TaxID=83380 RepID=UPI00138392C7|nr:hypothetical protein [Streptomyces sp. SID6013]WTB51635.1 hypothetical protein OG968_35940 [Streptomyces althioticus]
MTIPDSPQLQDVYGNDGVPFIVDANLPAEALQVVARCRGLTRASLRRALPFKRQWVLAPTTAYFSRETAGVLALVGIPERACEAYRDAHDVLRIWFETGDTSAALTFADKWRLQVRGRKNLQSILDGVQQVISDNRDIYRNELFIERLNRETRRLHAANKPLYTRQLKHKHIGSLSDVEVAARQDRSLDEVLAEGLEHPCLDVLLADFRDDQRKAVYARWLDDEVADWHQAAVYVGAKFPGKFKELVRRKLNRARDKHRAETPGGCRHCRIGKPRKAKTSQVLPPPMTGSAEAAPDATGEVDLRD